MKSITCHAVYLIIALFLMGCGGSFESSEIQQGSLDLIRVTPTPVASPTLAPTLSPSPTATVTPSPSQMPTPSSIPTVTPTPSIAPNPTVTPPPPVEVQNSNWGKFASLMRAGDFLEYTNSTNEGFGANWITGWHFNYGAILRWDSVNKNIWVKLKKQQTDHNEYVVLRYSLTTNQWTRVYYIDSDAGPWPMGKQSGHGYGSFDVDPIKNTLVFHPLGQNNIVYLDTSRPAGTTSTDTKWRAYGNAVVEGEGWSSQPLSLVYHPKLFGPNTEDRGFVLSFTGPSKNYSYGAFLYNIARDTWTRLGMTSANIPDGDRHGIGVYVPARNEVVFSQGDNSTVMHSVGQGAVLTRLQDAPIGYEPSVHANLVGARIADGPSGTAYIFGNKGGQKVYRLTPQNTWEDTRILHPFVTPDSDTVNLTRYHLTWIPEIGVYVYMYPENAANVATKPKIYFWKPPIGF